jgi:YidC/Oxa1 family membrane protein insertase
MEFGFAIGTSGDFRYDLISNGSNGYFAFDSFTMQFGPFFGLFIYPGALFATFISYLGKD